VLLVEDDDLIRATAAAMLSEVGCQVAQRDQRGALVRVAAKPSTLRRELLMFRFQTALPC
jgi:CheY-like chemotaxis protein